MLNPDDRATPAVDEPARLQRVARRGCAGLAYTIVLVPLVLVIWFFSLPPLPGERVPASA